VLENRVLRRVFGPKWKFSEAEEDCIIRSIYLLRFTKYCLGDQIKGDEMGGACSLHGRDGRWVHILIGKPKGKGHKEDIGVDGKIL